MADIKKSNINIKINYSSDGTLEHGITEIEQNGQAIGIHNSEIPLLIEKLSEILKKLV
jgi:hypothetical protein